MNRFTNSRGNRLRLPHWAPALLGIGLWLGAAALLPAQTQPAAQPPTAFKGETTQGYNQRLEQLVKGGEQVSAPKPNEYRIGPEDLLQISVLEAPDLSRTVRVSAGGEISLPLLGSVQVAGLTSRGLEAVLENLLRRNYMKDPQVSVFVQEMQSHPVSVFGAVEKPGVYQIPGPKSLIDVLSMAQGLATDAGDTIIVMRRAEDPATPTTVASLRPSPKVNNRQLGDTSATSGSADPPDGKATAARSLTISLKRLLESGSPRYNVLVYPGDIVKVTRAGIVYVVGEVRKPGGFLLNTNENISVLQALALAEGLSPTAKGKDARIIFARQSNGTRAQKTINLEKILAGKAPDMTLEANDILFVPNSTGKAFWHGLERGTTGIISAVSTAAVYRY